MASESRAIGERYREINEEETHRRTARRHSGIPNESLMKICFRVMNPVTADMT